MRHYTGQTTPHNSTITRGLVMARGTTNAEITTVHTAGKPMTRERANRRDKIASSDWIWRKMTMRSKSLVILYIYIYINKNNWMHLVSFSYLSSFWIFPDTIHEVQEEKQAQVFGRAWQNLILGVMCAGEVDEVRQSNACLMGSGVSSWSYIQNLRPASWIHTAGAGLTSHCTETTYTRHLLANIYYSTALASSFSFTTGRVALHDCLLCQITVTYLFTYKPMLSPEHDEATLGLKVHMTS